MYKYEDICHVYQYMCTYMYICWCLVNKIVGWIVWLGEWAMETATTTAIELQARLAD